MFGRAGPTSDLSARWLLIPKFPATVNQLIGLYPGEGKGIASRSGELAQFKGKVNSREKKRAVFRPTAGLAVSDEVKGFAEAREEAS
jgi:hypothetical protein